MFVMVDCSSLGNESMFVMVDCSSLGNESMDVQHTCNQECGCDYVTFDPVCSHDSILYYSPCHAGCSQKYSSDDQTVPYFQFYPQLTQIYDTMDIVSNNNNNNN